MKLIGLTGGIASGKSTAGKMLAKAGVAVIDADVLARDAVAVGSPGLAAIVERFGSEVLLPEGGLDRKKLGSIVFKNDELRRALNHIVHPEVGRLAAERLEQLRARGVDVAVYEVPLLFENNLEGAMDGTILIACSDAVQLRRTMERDSLDEAGARARIASQMSLADKRKRAGVVVENDSSLADLASRLSDAFFAVSGQRLALSAA
ncbi:MAG: dephospho-CoA kinase [Deltaproteobacteria bacterium]|nr:dephospho-CoA kinase [Deltaproteobacteria bacterium]